MAREHKILINGEWRETSTPLDVTNPYDGSTVGRTWAAGPEELEEALSASAAVFDTLKGLSAYRRAEIIEGVVRGLDAKAGELAMAIAREAGKPVQEALAEVKRAQSTFKIAAQEATRLGGEVLPLDIADGTDKRVGIVRRFPVGPVLGISPFNFPLNLVAHKVAPAMACGNPIIIKPASKTPITALLLGRIVEDAGWPAGGLNVVPCPGPVVEGILADERIKKLTFTGSAEVGWRLKGLAVGKKVTLELGGNAGVIVHSDADLELAIKRCVQGAFAFAGQVCISVQRIYVERSVFESFTQRFVEYTKGLKVGDPLDELTEVGPMIDQGALDKTEQWVGEAVAGGARILAGGERKGPAFMPTVLTKTDAQMKVVCEEVFAPVVVVEPYDSFESAVEEVNNSQYGLQAGVFTSDLKRIYGAYEALEVGGVMINDVPTFRVDSMPYGGVKRSGFGREGVRFAIEEMTEPRLLVLNLA